MGAGPAPVDHAVKRQPETINVARALELLAGTPKRSYREVGIILAKETGRSVAFHGSSVCNAILVAHGLKPSHAELYKRKKAKCANP